MFADDWGYGNDQPPGQSQTASEKGQSAPYVHVSCANLDDQRDDILGAFPRTKALVSFVVRMNREPIRSPARSVANLEFHHTGDQVNEVGRNIVRGLEEQGVRALNPAMGFPMEQDRFPGTIWGVSDKPVAVAAGLGMMGIHRNVIHQKFGNFIRTEFSKSSVAAVVTDSHDDFLCPEGVTWGVVAGRKRWEVRRSLPRSNTASPVSDPRSRCKRILTNWSSNSPLV